jgi:hypothetical protein
MRFEQIKKHKRDSKVHKLIDQFLETRYDAVEVINEEDYETNAAMTAAIRFAIKSYYEGKVEVSRKGDRVTLRKVKTGE